MFIEFIVLGIRLLLLFLSILFVVVLITQIIYVKLKFLHSRKYRGIRTISFVHPFCADCGGGEKVLWRMITSLLHPPANMINSLSKIPKIKINIISGKKDDINDLKKKLKERFNIELDRNSPNNNFESPPSINTPVVQVELISLRSGYLLQPKNFFTMFLQILGQIYFAYEIITKVYSDVYCETTGLPFTYFILKFLGHAKVTAYTHYPFISPEMIYQVQHNISGVHSRGAASRYAFMKNIKLIYYRLILKLYSIMGNYCLSYAYVNSTWTLNHMKLIWNHLNSKDNLKILYPPCSTSIYHVAAENQDKKNIIVSFAQFRPEKQQDMQIRIFAKIKEDFKSYQGYEDLELHIIGGVRNNNDQEILDELIRYSKSLGVGDSVKFLRNGTIEQIINEFSQAKIGIHTMVAEHFGITLIEMMAAGLIVVTHNSAGAKDDILTLNDGFKPGFLVENEYDYVKKIEEILLKYNEMRNLIIEPSMQRAETFSDDNFSILFISQIDNFI